MRTLKRSTWWVLALYAVALVTTLSVAVILHYAKKTGIEPAQFLKQLTLTNTYVGDETCAACHQQKTAAYHRTAHYITSAWPSSESIKGHFTPGANVLKTADTNLHFEMQ